MGLLITQTSLAEKIIHVALVPVNIYQRIEFQHPSSISFTDMEGVPK